MSETIQPDANRVSGPSIDINESEVNEIIESSKGASYFDASRSMYIIRPQVSFYGRFCELGSLAPEATFGFCES